jgi:3-methyladenine DNA glycosylase AlkD
MDIVSYRLTMKSLFEAAANPSLAVGQMNYMRNQFLFYGIKTPERRALIKDFFATAGYPCQSSLGQLLLDCFEEDHREMHYFALDLAQRRLTYQEAAFIDVLEQLITTNPWWDTVDWLASLTGEHLKRFPDLILPKNQQWMDSGHLWLQRVAIIFQLKYKDKTDKTLLFNNISQLASSKEFFIQKAAGWALRAYAQTNPDAVIEFVHNHQLASLTKREALRRLKT